jgi:hypothetical protein
MRTTLTLEPDVAIELERRRRERGTSLKQEVNSLIRAGLAREEETEEQPKERFTVRPLNVGKPLIDNFDDIQGILDKYEDPLSL